MQRYYSSQSLHFYWKPFAITIVHPIVINDFHCNQKTEVSFLLYINLANLYLTCNCSNPVEKYSFNPHVKIALSQYLDKIMKTLEFVEKINWQNNVANIY